jgi:hypothetical protein
LQRSDELRSGFLVANIPASKFVVLAVICFCSDRLISWLVDSNNDFEKVDFG